VSVDRCRDGEGLGGHGGAEPSGPAVDSQRDIRAGPRWRSQPFPFREDRRCCPATKRLPCRCDPLDVTQGVCKRGPSSRSVTAG
jgi:hypothetical protein